MVSLPVKNLVGAGSELNVIVDFVNVVFCTAITLTGGVAALWDAVLKTTPTMLDVT